MAITRQKKEELLQELVDKFGKSKSVVFADYRGLDVAGVSDLRRKLREKDAEMKVAKKTLINLAAKEQKLDQIDPSFIEGPVAATFSYEDELSGLQVLFKFSKDNENLKLLGGIIDGKVIGPDEIRKYAILPSREELLAKFIGSINSPVSGFIGVLGNVMSGFVRVLQAYKDTLPAEQAEVPPAANAPEVPSRQGGTEETKSEAPETPEEPSVEGGEAETSAEQEPQSEQGEEGTSATPKETEGEQEEAQSEEKSK